MSDWGDSPDPQVIQLHGLLTGLAARAFNREPKNMPDLIELDLCMRLTENLIAQYPALTAGVSGARQTQDKP